jgi:S1-C subfamily serine protease
VRIKRSRLGFTVAAVAATGALVSACDPGDNGASAGEASSTSTSTGPAARSDGTFAEIPGVVRDVLPSVVSVRRVGGEGSGIVWDADGTIVTNAHVVDGVDEATIVFADGEASSATVVARDPLTDIAVLQAERTGLPPAQFATDLPTVGELAIAMGNPLGLESTVSAGVVSGLQRSVPGAEGAPALSDLVQTDAAISPGNSGGALVDRHGQVIGMNVAYVPPQARAVSIGFAIPAPTVRDIVGQLLEDGSAAHPFIGITPNTLTAEIAEQLDTPVDEGVVVVSVTQNGPAAEAGVVPGDVLVSLGGESVANVQDLFAELRKHRPGERVAVTVVRDGGRIELPVVLGDRADFARSS